MDTKLDFKIQTILDNYEVIGSGPMITTPCQIGEWWVTPLKDYKGQIPADIQQKLNEFLSSGVKIEGLLVADDMRDIRIKRAQEAKRKETQMQAVEAGVLIAVNILGRVALGFVYLMAAALFAVDPMLIAVLPDGRWICLGSWYD